MPDDEVAPQLVVFRCLECGDTFPADAAQTVVCTSCGSEAVEQASEPLL